MIRRVKAQSLGVFHAQIMRELVNEASVHTLATSSHSLVMMHYTLTEIPLRDLKGHQHGVTDFTGCSSSLQIPASMALNGTLSRLGLPDLVTGFGVKMTRGKDF